MMKKTEPFKVASPKSIRTSNNEIVKNIDERRVEGTDKILAKSKILKNCKKPKIL